MYKQTIRFERAQDAHVFDAHLLEFLRQVSETEQDSAALFSTGSVDNDAHVRVVQTDSASMLGRLLTFLSDRNFPPATRPVQTAAAWAH